MINKKIKIGETYIEFVLRDGKVFPDNLYPIKKTSFSKVRYVQK